jgi:hypothetical protein
MSTLAMDHTVPLQLVSQHVTHADRASRRVGVVAVVGAAFAAWASSWLTKAVVRIVDKQACDFQDQAIWFAGMANAVSALPIGDALDSEFVLGDRLRALEDRTSELRTELTKLVAVRATRTGSAHGPKMEAVRRVISALEEVGDNAGDLRAALQAYESSRSVIARAARRVCTTPDELTSELHDFTV